MVREDLTEKMTFEKIVKEIREQATGYVEGKCPREQPGQRLLE